MQYAHIPPSYSTWIDIYDRLVHFTDNNILDVKYIVDIIRNLDNDFQFLRIFKLLEMFSVRKSKNRELSERIIDILVAINDITIERTYNFSFKFNKKVLYSLFKRGISEYKLIDSFESAVKRYKNMEELEDYDIIEEFYVYEFPKTSPFFYSSVDNVEMLISFLNSNDHFFPPETTVEKFFGPQFNDHIEEVYQRCNLMAIAALFGSERVFRYLRDNYHSLLDGEVFKAAFIGGNNEIMKLVKDHEKAQVCLKYSVRYFRNDIFFDNSPKFKVIYLNEAVNSLNADVFYKILSKDKLDKHQKNEQKLMPLLFDIVALNEQEMLKTLIEKGMSECLKDEIGRAALHHAVDKGCHEVVEILLKEGCSVDAKDSKGIFPLYTAVVNQDLPMIKLLISNGANINEKNSNEAPAIHAVCKKGNIEILSYLVENKADISLVDKDGVSTLHHTVDNKHYEATKFLVEQGASPHWKTKDGWTPLHWSARSGSKEICQYLVENGGDINCRNLQGFPPHLYSAMYGRRQALEYFLDIGANVNDASNDGWTALHSAAGNDFSEICEFLVSRGADVCALTKKGKTPKMIAEFKNHTKVVSFFDRLEKERPELFQQHEPPPPQTEE